MAREPARIRYLKLRLAAPAIKPKRICPPMCTMSSPPVNGLSRYWCSSNRNPIREKLAARIQYKKEVLMI